MQLPIHDATGLVQTANVPLHLLGRTIGTHVQIVERDIGLVTVTVTLVHIRKLPCTRAATLDRTKSDAELRSRGNIC